jgi:hypothetical protein
MFGGTTRVGAVGWTRRGRRPERWIVGAALGFGAVLPEAAAQTAPRPAEAGPSGAVAAPTKSGQLESESPGSTDAIDPRRRFQLGFHLGAGPTLGNADDGVSMSKRIGVAPTYLVEGFVRVVPRISLGLLAGGVVSLRSGTCPAEKDGYSCGLTGLGVAAAMVRYHLAPVGRWQPWLGVGPAFGVFGESAKQTVPAPSGFCLIGCGPRERTRSTYRYGPEGVIGVGASVPLGARVMLGGAVHGIFGSYLRGKTTEEISGGGESSSQSFSVSDGVHAVFLATIHLQIGLGS